MRMTLCVLLLTSISWLFAAGNVGLLGDESPRIVSLENSWDQAETKHDSKAMSLLVSDPFDYTDDDGSYMDRVQWLAHVDKGIDQYEHLDSSKMTVHQHENVAIVTGTYREQLCGKGKAVIRSGRFTDTWIYKSGEWKCAASQSTLLGH